MIRRRSVLAALAALAVCTVNAAAQAPAPARSDALDLERYEQIVKTYRSGEVAAAIRDRVALTRGEDTARGWAKYSWRLTLDDEAKGLERRDIGKLLLGAAALELETGRSQVLAGDKDGGYGHLMLAIAFVDSPDWARRSEVVTRIARDEHRVVRRAAYLLVAAVLHGELELVALARHVERMTGALPDDGEAHLAAGSLFETYTLPGVAEQLRPPVGSTMDPGLWRRQRVDSGRQEALAHYRRAVAIDPSLAEAQMRLGRMLSQRKDWVEAESALSAARQAATNPHTRYLTALFLGNVLSERGWPSDAIGLFRSAVDAVPDAQSGRLALSAALRASGDATGADTAVDPLLHRHVSSAMASDPWWLYRYGQRWRIDAWIEGLRQAVKP